MTNPTPLRQLIEMKLGEPVEVFVAARRPARSWRQIRDEVQERTGMTITHETLRGWVEPAA